MSNYRKALVRLATMMKNQNVRNELFFEAEESAASALRLPRRVKRLENRVLPKIAGEKRSTAYSKSAPSVDKHTHEVIRNKRQSYVNSTRGLSWWNPELNYF
ncbi:hypothetical protein CYMTET_26004 [Cymbomonas tetramitiformis]|uniref:Uncharacterized protein n=1 Tax=Cymbomonas tetramitiformis TaxID=36881 RepID=A0AAE0FTA9_9CHLO|nr:hypothetical protein CYMTET_26004 [Cymbomonas tetramitiformis]